VWHVWHILPRLAVVVFTSSHLPAAAATSIASAVLRASCAQPIASALPCGLKNASVAVNACLSVAACSCAPFWSDFSMMPRKAPLAQVRP